MMFRGQPRLTEIAPDCMETAEHVAWLAEVGEDHLLDATIYREYGDDEWADERDSRSLEKAYQIMGWEIRQGRTHPLHALA